MENKKGFTLLETIVAVGIFSIVLLISAGALISMMGANRKAQAMKSVMNNLNFAMDSMTREIRVGRNYSLPGTSFTFRNSDGETITYSLNSGQIERGDDTGSAAMTAPEVVVDTLEFQLSGELAGDTEQPALIIIVQGHTGESIKTRTDFNLQTFVSQRSPDS